MVNIYLEIKKLLRYALENELISNFDINYTKNRLLEILNLDNFEDPKVNNEYLDLDEILENILNWANENKLLENDSIVYRDLFDTKIMGCLIGRPSQIIDKFNYLYRESPKKATNYFYDLSNKSNYIRWSRVQKDLKWKTQTEYGDLDITINLSKPEKDPKVIAMAKNMSSSSYPKCLLCKENEEYKGRINHPARQNLRLIPLKLNNEEWYLQYSPYVYYNEHCIVLKGEHDPMKISKQTFIRLLDFVEEFPHYFLGSNADLPIVGGSILTHDHFQGGNYEFPMAKAPIEEFYKINRFESVKVGRVRWPMSVIRLQGKNKEELVNLSDYILSKWREYSDNNLEINSNTQGIPHNTITPIVRRRDNFFEMDLVLRNNRTSDEYEDGIFHPHKELHHIKKENIGLIEVMGLAVLPARLKDEIQELIPYILKEKDISLLQKDKILNKHVNWINEFAVKYPNINVKNINEIINKEVGLKFEKVLEHAGVYKRDIKGIEGFSKFIKSL